MKISAPLVFEQHLKILPSRLVIWDWKKNLELEAQNIRFSDNSGKYLNIMSCGDVLRKFITEWTEIIYTFGRNT